MTTLDSTDPLAKAIAERDVERAQNATLHDELTRLREELNKTREDFGNACDVGRRMEAELERTREMTARLRRDLDHLEEDALLTRTFCPACNGTGTIRSETVCLRWVDCLVCGGTSESRAAQIDERLRQKLKAMPDRDSDGTQGETEMTRKQQELIAEHAPYTLKRSNGVVLDGNGIALMQMCNETGGVSAWDRAVVALLNEVARDAKIDGH
jgi:hypothetical protein